MSGDCWLWTGALDTHGYGQFRDDDRQVHAHRFAYEQAYGLIQDGLSVLHDCPDGDRRDCVRPSHLWLGTTADNMADMVRKGKSAKGKRHGLAIHPESIRRGEHHHAAKLTDAKVREIRALIQSGMLGKDIATLYGVGPHIISSVKTKKTWRHV